MSEQTLKPSFYNLRYSVDGHLLVFNGATAAVIDVPKSIQDELQALLGPTRSKQAGTGYESWNPNSFKTSDVSGELQVYLDDLIAGGFFIEESFNERNNLRDEFVEERDIGPLMLTITTTLSCNMKCYYCFQPKTESKMSADTIKELVEYTLRRLKNESFSRIHVEWYGGEPMLNKDVIEEFSRTVIPYCDNNKIKYHASMLTNGTLWPDESTGFIEKARLTSVQISIDGPEAAHNKRRGIIVPEDRGRKNSFEIVMSLVDKLIAETRVHLRINVDPYSDDACLGLVDYFLERGWLYPGSNLYPYVAIINNMTEHCGFIGKHKRFRDFTSRFDQIRKEFDSKIGTHMGREALEEVMSAPRRVYLNCGAVNNNSVVFGPDGLAYKCGLDVGDDFRAHDTLGTARDIFDATQSRLDAKRWMNYDPFTHDRCKECQYLPICMGGCPKAQIESDEEQISMQSEYWENNTEDMVVNYWRANRL